MKYHVKELTTAFSYPFTYLILNTTSVSVWYSRPSPLTLTIPHFHRVKLSFDDCNIQSGDPYFVITNCLWLVLCIQYDYLGVSRWIWLEWKVRIGPTVSWTDILITSCSVIQLLYETWFRTMYLKIMSHHENSILLGNGPPVPMAII